MTDYRLIYTLMSIDNEDAEVSVDVSKGRSTETLGWNVSAAALLEFANRYPDEKFVIGVVE